MLLKSLNVENHQAYQLAYLRQIRNYYERNWSIHPGPGDFQHLMTSVTLFKNIFASKSYFNLFLIKKKT